MNPYNDRESKTAQVRDMFDSIARRYDLLNRMMTLGIDLSWRRKVVGAVKKSGARDILDAATGTGDVAVMLAKGIEGARITGIDLSPRMLEIGRAKASEAGLDGRIEMIEADAARLPFPDASFDAATAAFGVRNFEDIPAGMAEIRRVLKPEGSLFVLELGMPRNKIFSLFFRFYFRGILPVVGRVVSRDKKAYTYLPASVGEFPYGEPFVQILRETGFQKCTAKNLFGGVAQIYIAKK